MLRYLGFQLLLRAGSVVQLYIIDNGNRGERALVVVSCVCFKEAYTLILRGPEDDMPVVCVTTSSGTCWLWTPARVESKRWAVPVP